MKFATSISNLPGVLAIGLSVSLFALTAATAGPLSIGRGGDGGLDVGVNLGGVKADVSVGGDKVADVDVGVGDDAVTADVSVGGDSVADVSVGVGRDVGADVTMGGSSVADVGVAVGRDIGTDVTVGGTDVVSVGVNTPGTDIGGCIGACVGTPNTPGTPPTTTPPTNTPPTNPPPGTVPPGTVPPGVVAGVTGTVPKVPKVLACASAEGNTTAFNGYPLTDRSGRVVGVVHSAVLDGSAQIRTVSIRGVDKSCTTLKNGTFQVAGYAITGAFDAGRLGLATQ